MAKLSLGNIWKVEVTENLVYASFQSTNHILPKFDIFVDERLYFSVRVYGWMLPDNHEIYSMHSRSFMNVTFSNVTLSLGQLHLCNGMQTPDPGKAMNFLRVNHLQLVKNVKSKMSL